MTAIEFPVPEKFGYDKFANPASRFALVGVAVTKTAAGVRVAVTGAGASGAYRWTAAEQALGASFSAKALDGLEADASNLMSDIHADAVYRAHLIGVMAKRAVGAQPELITAGEHTAPRTGPPGQRCGSQGRPVPDWEAG